MTTLVTPDGLVAADPPSSSSSAAKSYPYAVATPMNWVTATPGALQLYGKAVTAATYETIYKAQPWVYVCVNKLTRGVAMLPLKTYQYLDATEEHRQRVKDHPLAQLISHPWPRGSAYALKEHIQWSLGIHGNCLLYKARPGPGRAPTELWPLPWYRVETHGDGSEAPDAYIFWALFGQRYVIDPADVIHLKAPGRLIGVSPMEPLARTLGLEDAAQQWAAGTFQRGASLGGVFSTERRLQNDSVPRLRAELEKLYGGIDNAGRFAILDQDLEFKAITQTAVDTSLIEQRRLSREEVAAVYDIPPPVIGILDRATFSNINEQHKMLYVDTLGPWLTMHEETFAAQLIAGEPAFEDAFLEYELGEILKADISARADAYMKLVHSGAKTPNDIRRLENDPPIDDDAANTIWMPVNLAPVGATDQQVAARAAASAVLGVRPLDATASAAAASNGSGDHG